MTPEKLERQLADHDRFSSQPAPGRMFAFWYDPKHKRTLPYYDRFPLIFMVGPAKGGFYGLNFHYLPYKGRAVLMDALYGIANNKRMDDTTKINASYDVLKGVSRFKHFAPCFKHYLTPHVQSRFLYIAPSEWDMAIMLPLARFEKASPFKVWAESMNKI